MMRFQRRRPAPVASILFYFAPHPHPSRPLPSSSNLQAKRRHWPKPLLRSQGLSIHRDMHISLFPPSLSRVPPHPTSTPFPPWKIRLQHERPEVLWTTFMAKEKRKKHGKKRVDIFNEWGYALCKYLVVYTFFSAEPLVSRALLHRIHHPL